MAKRRSRYVVSQGVVRPVSMSVYRNAVRQVRPGNRDLFTLSTVRPVVRSIARTLVNPSAPRRQARQVQKSVLKSVVTPREYSQLHNCGREWRKLLAWRSAQGNGRKRTRREKRNNKRNFDRNDC